MKVLLGRSKQANNDIAKWGRARRRSPAIIDDIKQQTLSSNDTDIDYKIIRNPFIIIIGIADYDDKNESLPQVKDDINKMKQLWRDKYRYKHVLCINDKIYKLGTFIKMRDLIKWINKRINQINDDETIDGLRY